MIKDKILIPWFAFWVALALVIGAGASCCITKIQTSEIQGIADKIIARHDAYVNEDPSLMQEQKTLFLSESLGLLKLLATRETVSSEELMAKAGAVCARHDNYVGMDEGLDALHRKAYLRSTELLIAVADSGG